MSLFQELKRRNVIRVGLAYLVTAWLLLQIADVIINNIGAPGWVFQVILLVMGLGFPLAVVFAWAYEMTPEGIKKEAEVDRSASITKTTGRKIDLVIIGVLVAALGYFAVDKFGAGDVEESTQTADKARSVTTSDENEAVPDKSIAVLPFVNMSSDPEQEYFSDGIAEELLNVLAQFPKLRVAARTSSFQFKGENLDIGKIAATLHVAHVLEGSVRKSGTRLRITAQLIKADNGYHLWSETYDRDLDDIFAVQDEIAAAISAALKAELNLGPEGAGSARPAVFQAENTQAYEAYLRGRQLIHNRGRESLEDAVRFLERALRLDANFAPAHAQLAIATAMLLESPSTYGNLSLADVRQRTQPHLEKALELAPNLGEAHAAMGLMGLNTGDPRATVRHTRKALEINPSDTDAMNWQYIALGDLGRYVEANDVLSQILEADPLSIVGRMNYAVQLRFEQKNSAAHAVADSLLEQSPWASFTAHGQIAIYSEAEVAKALSWNLQAYAADPGDMLSNQGLVDAFNWIGAYDEAQRVSDALVPRVNLAEGRTDEALTAITKKRQADPENQDLLLALANAYYYARRFDEAHASYEALARLVVPGRPLAPNLVSTIRLASIRRSSGDENGAAEAIRIVQTDLRALQEIAYQGPFFDAISAMLAAYDGDKDAMFRLLRNAVDAGLRDPLFFSDPFFDPVRDDRRFVDIESAALQALVAEREKALQLMCFNNPAPGAWQPLTETCAGVEQKPLEI
jgi:TolB-like protein/Flp pilus assembly protein TadD